MTIVRAELWLEFVVVKRHLFSDSHHVASNEEVKSKSMLKGSDDGVMHIEESCFRTLSIVQCFSLKTTFRKLALLPSSGKGGGGRGDTYSVGSLRKS
jgi:hypothetical protein